LKRAGDIFFDEGRGSQSNHHILSPITAALCQGFCYSQRRRPLDTACGGASTRQKFLNPPAGELAARDSKKCANPQRNKFLTPKTKQKTDTGKKLVVFRNKILRTS
jgi:hypothetical protein